MPASRRNCVAEIDVLPWITMSWGTSVPTGVVTVGNACGEICFPVQGVTGMNDEKSCGGIVYTRQGSQTLYVVIQHLGGHWGFPKGHMEAGEDEQTTALREIREEIGVNVRLIDEFRTVEEYPLPNKPGVTKQVVYFLAEYSGQELRYQKEELKAACLLPYEEAMERLTFPEARQLLLEANDFMRSNAI